MARVHLRIISDLHYAEGPSRIHDLRAINPLLDEPEYIVFNGDSLETRFVSTSRYFADHRAKFLEFITPLGQRLTLLTGNHDPDISPFHHLDVAAGRVLVTHGDVLFPDIAPWGWEAAHVRAAYQTMITSLPEDRRNTLEGRLEVCKRSSLATSHLSPGHHIGAHPFLGRWLRLLSRLRRADKVFTSWWRTPRLAADLARDCRPQAQIVVIGHTHFSGVWHVSGHTIINTGSFGPLFGARAVDFVDGAIEVRPLRLRRGEVRLHPEALRIPFDHEVTGSR